MTNSIAVSTCCDLMNMFKLTYMYFLKCLLAKDYKTSQSTKHLYDTAVRDVCDYRNSINISRR